MMQVSFALRDEVVDSLRHGDHGGMSAPRALVGIVLLHLHGVLRSFRGGWRPNQLFRPAGIVLVVANPVQHGARFALAVIESAASADVRIATVADGRLADRSLVVDLDFPGIGVRSMIRVADVRGLRWAWRVVLRGSQAAVWLPRRRLVRTYLVLAQALRYRVATMTVAGLPASCGHVVDYDRNTYARPWGWAVQRAGHTLTTLVHGSPSVATYLPLIASHVLVWGDVQRAFVEGASARATVVGRPEIMMVARRSERPTCFVCHSMEDLSDREVSRLVKTLERLRSEGYSLVLKPHPKSRAGGIIGRGWSEVAGFVGSSADAQAPLFSLLGLGDVIVTITSTSAVDALCAGIPALVLSDTGRPLSCDLEVIRDWTAALADGVQSLADVDLTATRAQLVTAVGDEAGLMMGRALVRLLDDVRRRPAADA